MRAIHFAIFGLLAACGSDPTTGDDTTEEGALSPAAPDGGQQLATSTYHLEPGKEIYYCYQFYAPSEQVAITHISPIQGPGVHHLGLYQAYGRDEEMAPHECPTLIKQTWMPIWGNNTTPQDMEMPQGTGFIIEPGTQYIVQLHLQNTGDEALDIRVGLNLSYEHDVSKIIPAGIFALGAMQFEIPANTEDHAIDISDCTPNRDMNIFAVEPHMHKIGKTIETSVISNDVSTSLYKIDPWKFGEQPIDKLAKTLTPADKLHTTCHYQNRTASPVKYGESSDEEMCFFVLYYYPYDHIDGCIINL